MLALLVCVCSSVLAQNDLDSIPAKGRLEYFFYIQSGMLAGCNECNRGKEISFSGATVHGVKIGKRTRAGIGLGYDSFYGLSTVPLFGSASWDLFARKNAFFLQFNYGGALKVWKYTEYEEYGYQRSEGGRMVNPMVGYRIKYHDASISLLVGYKFQKVTSTYEYENYYWNPLTERFIQEPLISNEKRSINRFMISLAIGWK